MNIKEITKLHGKIVDKVTYQLDEKIDDSIEVRFTDGSFLRVDANHGRLFICAEDESDFWYVS